MTRAERKQYNYWLKHRINNEGRLECRCTICLEWKIEDDSYYLKNKSKPELGYSPECKTCSIIRSQIIASKMSEEKKEQLRMERKQRYEKDRDIELERVSLWFQNNKDYKRGYLKEYYVKNPEQMKLYAQQHRDHDVSEAEYQSMLKVFDYKCAYCSMNLEEHKKKYHERLHNDHVDDDGYNDLRNDVPACKSCNCGKHQRDMEEWFRKQKFFSIDKLNKVKWWTSEGYKDYIEDKPPYRISRRRIYNEDSSYYMIHELWTVDEKRNMIELIGEGNKKKDLNLYIREYLNVLENDNSKKVI
jgi:hypothetical protein